MSCNSCAASMLVKCLLNVFWSRFAQARNRSELKVCGLVWSGVTLLCADDQRRGSCTVCQSCSNLHHRAHPPSVDPHGGQQEAYSTGQSHVGASSTRVGKQIRLFWRHRSTDEETRDFLKFASLFRLILVYCSNSKNIWLSIFLITSHL